MGKYRELQPDMAIEEELGLEDEDKMLQDIEWASDGPGLMEHDVREEQKQVGKVMGAVCFGLMALVLFVVAVAGAKTVAKHQHQHQHQQQHDDLIRVNDSGETIMTTGDGGGIAGNPRIVVPRPQEQVIPQAELEAWGQLRPDQYLGTSDDFVNMNRYNNEVEKKMRRMELLNRVRFGHCNDFERHMEEVKSDSQSLTTNWYRNNQTSAKYCPDGESAREHKNCSVIDVERAVCDAPHPTREGVTVTIERFGPFTGHGGYDWVRMHPQGVLNVGAKNDVFKGKDVYLVGGMFAPVFSNGTIIGYPPIHIHHAHLYPYGDDNERAEKIKGSLVDHHDLVFQNHGDSECKPEEGGVACLLHELDEGYGFRMRNSLSGLSTDFELNDVRPTPAEPIEYYMELVVMHMVDPPKEIRPKPVTFLGLNNPCLGFGPCTYHYPLDPNSNVLWYNYTHNLSSGYLSDFIIHSHQTIFDSMFIFKGKEVHKTIDSFRQSKAMPFILECNGYDLEQAKRVMFSYMLKNASDSLVCEVTKPSLRFDCEKGKEECVVHDKRVTANCREKVRIETGDILTVVAFNKVRPRSWLSRTSPTVIKNNVYSPRRKPYYAGFQHSIFRADFYPDEDLPGYDNPPSFFHYGKPAIDIDDTDYDSITGSCKNLAISFSMSPTTLQKEHV